MILDFGIRKCERVFCGEDDGVGGVHTGTHENRVKTSDNQI